MDKIETLLGIVGDFLNNPTVLTIFALAAGMGLVLLLLMHPRAFDRPKDKKIELMDWLGLTSSFVTERYRPMGRAIMVVVVLICGVLVASGVMAMIGLWQALWSITTAAPERLATNETVRGYAFALAAIFGLPFLVWRSVVAQQQANITEQGQITDRISKAVEQLGAMRIKKERDGAEEFLPNLEVRIGGIYALERIAQDSLRDHVQIMEILCAYVQGNAPASGAVNLSTSPEYLKDCITQADQEGNDTSDLRKNGNNPEKVKPRTDIQAILKVIGRRTAHQRAKEVEDTRHHEDGYRVDLRDTDLQGADMRGLYFSRALFKNSKMAGANLNVADLKEARFGKADLKGAHLRRADLIGARFGMAEIDATTDFTASFCQFLAVKSFDFKENTNLDQSQIDQMFGDATTKLPRNITPPPWHLVELSWDEFQKQWTALKNKPS